MNEISLKINIKFLTWYSQFHAIHVNSIWVQLKSYLRKWRQSRDRKCHQSCAMSGSMFCASATGSCAISALVGPLDRKWQSRDRKRSWPEVCSAHARLFPPRFFLSSSTVVPWLPDVTEDHLTPFGFLLGVRMHNRKLRNTRNDRRSCDPFGSVHGVFSTTSASYNHRKPRVLYLAWLLELALVICPFYFRIVSI